MEMKERSKTLNHFQTMSNPKRLVVDFTYVEKAGSDLTAIKILVGEFRNVIYTYGKVSLKEEGDGLKVSFSFRLEHVPDPLNVKEVEKSPAFKETIGDILSVILSERAATEPLHHGTKQISADNSPQDSHSQ